MWHSTGSRQPGPPIIAYLAASLGFALVVTSVAGWANATFFDPAIQGFSAGALGPRVRDRAIEPRPIGALTRIGASGRRIGAPARISAPARIGAPQWIQIPAIGVSARVVRLHLNPDATLQVPSNFSDAGWYAGSSSPGEPGPAVIVGHVDSHSGPAVFFGLRELSPGSKVIVGTQDGVQRLFLVARVAEFPKSSFPSAAVYGATAKPTLRLITCGGAFDHATGHYVDNVVVFARAVGM